MYLKHTTRGWLLGTFCPIFLFGTISWYSPLWAQTSEKAGKQPLSMGIEALDYEFWISVKDSNDAKEFEEYLKVFPDGIYSGLARARMKSIQATGQIAKGNRKEIGELALQVTALKKEKSALLADKESLGEQLATVTGERQQLSADKATLLETRETLEGEAEQLATTQAQQQQQLLELESVRVGLSDDLSHLQGVLDLEQRESATLAQKVVTLELARHETVTHLNGLLAQLDSENQGLDASLRQLHNEKYRAEVTLQDRARQIESLSQQVETLLSEKRSQRQPAPPTAVAGNSVAPPAPTIAAAENPPAQKLFAAAEKNNTNLSTATAPSLAAPETGNAVHDVKPRPVAGNPKPVYPRLAIRRQLEGTVILTIDVLPSGKVANISVETGSGFSLLDQAAIKAVSQWRFTPAHRVGTPTMAVSQSIQFQLDGRS